MRNFLLFALVSVTLLGSCTLDPECEWTDLYAEFETYDFTTDLEHLKCKQFFTIFSPFFLKSQNHNS